MGFAGILLFLVKDLAAHPGDQFALVGFNMRLEIVRVSIAVQVGPEHSLRLADFGNADSFKSLLQAGPGVKANEIDIVGPLQHQLRHDRIVIIGF